MKRKKARHIHTVYHAFLDKFKPTVALKNKKPVKVGKHKVYLSKEEWKWIGYDLMTRVASFAKLYPDDVHIVHCDDNWHAGSDLVLIYHRHGKTFFGTTVVFIPQCTGENPTMFFLYDDHRRNLIKELRNISKFIKDRKLKDVD